MNETVPSSLSEMDRNVITDDVESDEKYCLLSHLSSDSDRFPKTIRAE